MNNLIRRRLKIQPPLRGRLATIVSERQKKDYSSPTVYEPYSLPRRSKIKNDAGSFGDDSYFQSIEKKKQGKTVSSRTIQFIIKSIVLISILLLIIDLLILIVGKL